MVSTLIFSMRSHDHRSVWLDKTPPNNVPYTMNQCKSAKTPSLSRDLKDSVSTEVFSKMAHLHHLSYLTIIKVILVFLTQLCWVGLCQSNNDSSLFNYTDYTKSDLILQSANNTRFEIARIQPFKTNVTFPILRFSNESNTDLLKLAMDKVENGSSFYFQIYVGARDYLHKVSVNSGEPRDFFKLEKSVYVPLNLSTNECMPELVPSQPQSNDLKVVFLLRTLVFACGTDNCGRCVPYRKNNLTAGNLKHSTLKDAEFIGSRKSVVYFEGNYNGARAIFFGIEPDGRPDEFTTPFFSARSFANSAWTYTKQVGQTQKSSIQLFKDFRSSYPMNFVYGFTLQNFSYLLTVQPADLSYNVTSEPKFETRLSRICVNDSFFNSYIEIPLVCRGKDKKDYYVARSATLSHFIGPKTQSDTLYVVFDHPEGVSTSICAFPINDAQKLFEDAAANCNARADQAEILPAIVGHTKSCISHSETYTSHELTCGDRKKQKHYNENILSKRALEGNYVFTLNDIATSLGAVNLEANNAPMTYLLVGTQRSRLLQLRLNNGDLHSIKHIVELDPSVGPFLPDPLFEASSKDFYMMTTRSLMQVATTECAVFVSCAACVNSGDGCLWHNDQCKSIEFFPSDQRILICPPEVYSFEPKEGPPEGGTTLTFYGLNFGDDRTTKSDENYIQVKVGNRNCAVTVRNQTTVKCKIDESTDDYANSGIISIEARQQDFTFLDHSQPDFLGYNIQGRVTVAQPFVFKNASLKGIHPSFGPMSGGTRVAVYGENLHIGTSISVAFGDSDCRVINRKSKYVICESSISNKTQSQQIRLSIDALDFVVNSGRKIEVDGSYLFNPDYEQTSLVERQRSTFGVTQVSHPFNRSSTTFTRLLMAQPRQLEFVEIFTYKPNPTITDIRDREIATTHIVDEFRTIATGGTSLWFEGDHLDSVKYPMLDVIVDGRPLNNGSLCVLVHPTKIRCILPPLIKSPASSQQPVEARYKLHLDGFVVSGLTSKSTKQISKSKLFYHYNPILFPFNSTGIVRREDGLLEIQGRYLHHDLPFRITVHNGSIACVDTGHSTENLIKCKLDASEETLDDLLGVDLNLRVSIGQLDLSIGTVRLQKEQKISPAAIASIVVSIIMLTVIMVFLIITYRRSEFKKVPKNEMEMKTLEDLFYDAFQNYDIYNDLNKRGFIVNDPDLVIHIDGLKLGSGNFGSVHRGKYQNQDVAVKNLIRKDELDAQTQLRCFFDEAYVMRVFKHENVLSLVGVTMENASPVLLLEFMSFGDLLSYVRNENNHPNVEQLLDFAIQIAQGMDYLSKQNFIHRDLAARNCLIGQFNMRLVVKVADFGLSRKFKDDQNYYRVNMENVLPWGWMPLELLEGINIFTSKCDVWSYGVVLWELLTRGCKPYADMSYNEVRNYLKNGNRLQQFDYCPDLIYSIMMCCWYANPEDRPSFEQVLQMMNQALEFLRYQASNTYIQPSTITSSQFRPCPLDYTRPDIKNQVSNYHSLVMEKAVHLARDSGSGATHTAADEPNSDEDFDTSSYRQCPPPSYTAATMLPPENAVTTTMANNYYGEPSTSALPNGFSGHGSLSNNNNNINDYSGFSEMATLPR